MDYHSHSVALGWFDAKGAALFFEKVIPAQIHEMHRYADDDPIYYEVLNDLLPAALLEPASPGRVTGLAAPVITYVAHYYTTFPDLLGVTSLPGGETFEERRRSKQSGLVDAFDKYVDAAQVKDFSIYGDRLLASTDGSAAEPSLVLSNLQLVDTSRLSWRQLLEFRQDKDRMRKLGQLRRFVYDTYQSKSRDYIKEDLERRIEDYKAVTKFWNFPTRASLYTIALSSGGAIAAADVIGIALFGAPIGTAIVGVSAALGTAAIAVESRRREINLKKNSEAIAYLVEAQDLNWKRSSSPSLSARGQTQARVLPRYHEWESSQARNPVRASYA
ncbi:MAG TPA: hypothetical protein VGQ08_18485 [Nitrospiraceae bacterium]|jgi:hypothetical protein|nr:hypothetical protein [Nitrospiraceae bacterium]